MDTSGRTYITAGNRTLVDRNGTLDVNSFSITFDTSTIIHSFVEYSGGPTYSTGQIAEYTHDDTQFPILISNTTGLTPNPTRASINALDGGVFYEYERTQIGPDSHPSYRYDLRFSPEAINATNFHWLSLYNEGGGFISISHYDSSFSRVTRPLSSVLEANESTFLDDLTIRNYEDLFVISNKGSSRSAEIHGGAGDEKIYGGEGEDSISGWDGNDTLKGYNGNDLLEGGHGNDLLEGGHGNDILEGRYGDDTLKGGVGDDTLQGLFGDDMLEGGEGDDILYGSSGDNTLEGGQGNDTLVASGGNDTLDGGQVSLFGTEEIDVARLVGFRTSFDIHDDLESNTSTFRSIYSDDTKTLINIEKVEFSSDFSLSVYPFTFLKEMVDASLAVYPDYGGIFGDQSIWTSVHANQLGMPIQKDGLYNSPSPNHWTFANGEFRGLQFSSNMFASVAQVGEANIGGRHTVIVAFRGTDTSNLVAGFQDAVSGWGPQVRTFHWESLKPLIDGLENYLLEHPDLQLLFTGHSLGGTLAQMALEHFSYNADVRGATFGSPGAPTALGSDSRIIHFEHTEDIVPVVPSLGFFEKPGERILIPIDVLNDSSDDGLWTTEHNKEWYRDTVATLLSVADEPAFISARDGESGFGSIGNTYRAGEVVRVAADPRSSHTFGGDADSEVDELLFGQDGNDLINGQGGADSILGGIGNDTLIGGAGGDVLTGGTGNDVFKYRSILDFGPQYIETIKDFEKGLDTIDLSNFSSALIIPNNPNNVFEFIGTSEFSGDPMQLRFVTNSAGNAVLVEGNTDTDLSADFFIEVLGVGSLDHVDLLGVVRPARNYVEVNSEDETTDLLDESSEVLNGTPQEHDGDRYLNFNYGDALRFEGAQFSPTSLKVTQGSAILEIDLDLDGSVDSTVVLEGDYSSAQFRVEIDGSDTEISLFDGNSSPEGTLAVSGRPNLLQTLTVDASGISDRDGFDTAAVQWQRDGLDIADATSSSYALTADDVGSEIRAIFSFTDNFGSFERIVSENIGPIRLEDQPTVGAPIVLGTAEEDQVLTADIAGVSDADGIDQTSITYQWLRDGVEIAGATDSSYQLVQSDVGAQMSLRMDYTDNRGNSGSAFSEETAPVENLNDPAVGVMSITGTPWVGETLSSDASGITDEDGIVETTYYWTRDGVTIEGATQNTYTLTEADEGARIEAGARLVDTFGDVTFRSGASVVVNSSPTGMVALTGAAVRDGTLSADLSSVGDADGVIEETISYQWRRDGVDIPGPGDEAADYVLTAEDVGREITLQVTFVDETGKEEELISAPVVPIIADLLIEGGPLGDPLTGDGGNDTIIGNGGDDTLAGGFGDDILDGGAGIDTGVFGGNQASYTLTLSPTTTTLTDRSAGGYGTDQLTSVELLDFETEIPLFNDIPMNLDIFDGPTGLTAEDFGAIIELYIAYYNRAPDAIGLNYWGTEFSNGFTLPLMAKNFFGQPETQAAYASLLNDQGRLEITDRTKVEAFATEVYRNVLGREPDQDGLNYWIDELQNNQFITPDVFILAIIGGAKNPGNPTTQTALDQEYLATKADLGAYFAVIKGMSDLDDAAASLALFSTMDIEGSRAATIAAIDGHYADALDPVTGDFLMQLVGVIDDPFGGL